MGRTDVSFPYIIVGKSIRYTDGVWDDRTFPATQTPRFFADKPDFDTTNVGYLFPQNDESEVLYITDQMYHRYKQGSNLRPHVHFIQTSASIPIFELQHRWYNNGEIVPAFATIQTTGVGVLPYTSGSMLQITPFPEIDGTGKEMSSFFDFKIYRQTGDGISGDVLYKGFDFHFKSNGLGSVQEYVK